MLSTRFDVVTIGEILVEIMRKQKDVPHNVAGEYLGPYPSGAPAIFADSAARLGLNSAIIGVVGEDDFGELLLGRLRKDGVNTEAVKTARGYTTGIAFVMYRSSGERRFLFHLRHSAAGKLRPSDVAREKVGNSRALHIMGSSLSVSASSRKACERAASIALDSGLKITFDPNLRPELIGISKIRKLCLPILRHSEIVMPSKTEAEAITGEKDVVEAGLRLLEEGAKMAVVKMGSQGSVAVLNSREAVWAPAYPVEEIDPTGAGDVFDAAFVYMYLRGESVERCLEFANAAGAIKVTRFGPMEGPSSAEEVSAFMARNEEISKKVMRRNL
jgi:sugar/nucleoside kinase (ribokinase family)